MATAGDADKFDRERRIADARYNDALTAFDRALADCRGRELTRDDFDRLAHTLIMFLQQITAFVNANDRAIGSDVDRRMERIEHLFADIDERRTRVALLQGGSRQSRLVSDAPTAGQPNVSGAPIISPSSDLVYVGFEDRF